MLKMKNIRFNRNDFFHDLDDTYQSFVPYSFHLNIIFLIGYRRSIFISDNNMLIIIMDIGYKIFCITRDTRFLGIEFVLLRIESYMTDSFHKCMSKIYRVSINYFKLTLYNYISSNNKIFLAVSWEKNDLAFLKIITIFKLLQHYFFVRDL